MAELYVAKKNSLSSGVIGDYSVVRGCWGPALFRDIERYRMVEPSANPIKVGSQLKVYLMLGVIEPQNEQDVALLRKSAEEIMARLPEDDTVDPAELEKPTLPSGVSEEMVEVLALAISDKGEEGHEAREYIEGLFPKEAFDEDEAEPLPDPPEDYEFPAYNDMRKKLGEIDEDWREHLEENLPTPKKEDLQRIYHAYQEGIIS